MVPNVSIISTPINEQTHPNKTYKAVVDERLVIGQNVYKNRINNYVDDLDAIEQTIYFILGTERYQFPIYSWNYGVELIDLFGKPMPYVKAELPERIKEALTMDERISDVIDFEFKKNGKKLGVSFTVVTTAGNISSELEVEV